MSDDARVSLSEAIASTPIDSHRYLANIPLDHCYQKTAHGGLLVSIIVSAVQQHFRSTLVSFNHPDTFSIHTIFLHASVAGKATVVIKDTKLGSNVSTVHFALVQDDTERVVGYASNTNLETEKGVSFPIPRPFGLKTSPSDLTKLLEGSDPDWVGYSVPWHPHSFLKGITHFQFFSAVKAQSPQNTTEVWMRLSRNDQRFTTEMLGSVADHWRRMIENYVPKSAWNNEQLPKRAIQAAKEGRQILGYSTSYGYPTLAMHLEIKKKLPSQGVEWLFMRARSTGIKNGRFDAEVTIMDEKMEVVALSHQISYITKSMQIVDRERSPKDSKL